MVDAEDDDDDDFASFGLPASSPAALQVLTAAADEAAAPADIASDSTMKFAGHVGLADDEDEDDFRCVNLFPRSMTSQLHLFCAERFFHVPLLAKNVSSPNDYLSLALTHAPRPTHPRSEFGVPACPLAATFSQTGAAASSDDDDEFAEVTCAMPPHHHMPPRACSRRVWHASL
jgi:hypothetical protein